MKVLSKENILQGELYFFRSIFAIVDLLSNAFYYILLFKVTDQFAALFIDLIIYFLSQWTGLIIGNTLITRFGYIKTFKISFILNFIAMILLSFNLGRLAILYPLFAIFRSFPRGIFWAVNNNYLMRELGNNNRRVVVSDIVSITYVLQIFLPVLIGATVSINNDYSILFIISGFISLATIIIPWSYNKKPRTKVTFQEINKILKDKKFKSFSLILVIAAGMDAVIALTFAIIPFLFLKNEFGVGLLASLVNLIAALFAYIQRSKKIDRVKKTAYLGVSLSALFTLIFSFFWNFPALIIRGLFSTIGDSLYLPLIGKLDLDIREEVLKKDVNNSAAEMSIVVETLFTIGRISALTIFLLLLTSIQSDNIFRFIAIIYSLWILIYLYLLLKLRNKKSQTLEIEHANQIVDTSTLTTTSS